MAEDYSSAPYEHMSPTLLAQQPITLKNQAPPGKDWSAIYSICESRLGMLRSWRYSWWAYWASLAEYILPRRYHWLVVANRMTRGSPINQSIVDSTATLAMQTCASGLWTGLTSPSRPWFKLGDSYDQLDRDGKYWIEDTERKLYTVLGQSNFYTTMAQAFQDVSTFGTAPVIIYEDSEDVIRCYSPCAGEYYLDVGGRLSVDTLYREFTLNTTQIVEMFTLENCPQQIRTAWETGGASLSLEHVVAQAIEPNAAISPRHGTGNDANVTVVPSHFPWREVYWLKGVKTDRELSRRGFNERPFMAARWSTVSNDPYGRSPGMDALGDIKQLQQETRRKAELLEKVVRPPMGADPELKNEPSSILPGQITYMSTAGGRKGFFPLFEVNPQALQPIVQDIKEIQDRIKRCFFTDIFMAISQMEGVQPRNELELTKRDLERLQILGPFIELFETEFAGPAITRVLSIMRRRGMLLPLPQSLQNVPLKIEYISILKLAQRATETVAMKDTLGMAGSMSAAAKAAGVPDPLRIFNLDAAMRRYADMSSFPADALYTDQEVREQDAARQSAQAKQQAIAPTMAGVQAAKTLSETNVGGNSALNALLGIPGGQ